MQSLPKDLVDALSAAFAKQQKHIGFAQRSFVNSEWHKLPSRNQSYLPTFPVHLLQFQAGFNHFKLEATCNCELLQVLCSNR